MGIPFDPKTLHPGFTRTTDEGPGTSPETTSNKEGYSKGSPDLVSANQTSQTTNLRHDLGSAPVGGHLLLFKDACLAPPMDQWEWTLWFTATK